MTQIDLKYPFTENQVLRKQICVIYDQKKKNQNKDIVDIHFKYQLNGG